MYVIQNENTIQDCIVAQWLMTAVEQNASTHIIMLYLIQSIFKIPKNSNNIIIIWLYRIIKICVVTIYFNCYYNY